MIKKEITSVEEVLDLFPTTREEIEQYIDYIIRRTTECLNTIINHNDNERTFDNTVRAFDCTSQDFNQIHARIHLLEMVSTDPTLRRAAQAAIKKLNEYSINAFMNKDIYASFKGYITKSQNTLLNQEQRYLIEKQMKDFKRSGFDLDDESFKQVKKLKKEIENTCQAFSHAINNDANSIWVNKQELAGLRRDFIESLEKNYDGLHLLDCSYPIVKEVMSYCSVENTRKRLYHAFNNRAYPENVKRLEQLIAQRDQLARLLGFASYAHLDMDPYMVDNPEKAEKFLQELLERACIKQKKEFDTLITNLPQRVNLVDDKMQPWDYPYVFSQYKKKYFAFDEREFAEYFPLEKTIEGIFLIYQKFLDLSFESISISGAWHKDVRCIKVNNASDGVLRGYILLDLFPRSSKYSHACMAPVIHTVYDKNKQKKIKPAVCVVIANFPKPTADQPSLLKHSDVTTFFHEFGHAMHHVLGTTEFAELSGTSVMWDFVEMPSQMFEEWMWDKEMLQLVSSHYKTGAALPDDLIEKKIALKKIDAGYFVVRQATFSLISLAYFAAGAHKNTDQIISDISNRYNKFIRFDPTTHFQASFGHLTGYGAKYYTYLWSKVFALDLFAEVRKHGLLDKSIGKKFITEILGRGGSNHPKNLLRNFLGREPRQDAFFQDLGLTN